MRGVLKVVRELRRKPKVMKDEGKFSRRKKYSPWSNTAKRSLDLAMTSVVILRDQLVRNGDCETKKSELTKENKNVETINKYYSIEVFFFFLRMEEDALELYMEDFGMKSY